jgi:hypothetical protein
VPRLFATLASLLVLARLAHGEPGRMLDDDTFATRAGGPYIVDAGLLIGQPAALPTGITTGIGAGVTRECGCLFSYGVRASWSSETDLSTVWTLTHWDMRVRAIGSIRHTAGRGTLALRLGVGPTFVREDRYLTQGMRAGNLQETTAFAMLPAGELEAVVGLHIAGPWLAMVSAGPTLDVVNDKLRGGWIAQIGVGWQP